MTFCETLRILIEERGLTQKQLAQDLQIPVSTMGGYVQGTSEPDFDILRILAKYFHVSADYLLNIQTGKTESHEENELLRVYRSLTDEQKEMYIEQGKLYIRMNSKKNAELSKSTS